jgi:hypothetical protein
MKKEYQEMKREHKHLKKLNKNLAKKAKKRAYESDSSDSDASLRSWSGSRRGGKVSVYKKVNNSKCQLEYYTRPVPNKAANSKSELNKLNFLKLKPYYHSDTCSDSDDVIDSVTLTLSHDSNSDTSIIYTDDVDDDFTSTYSQ